MFDDYSNDDDVRMLLNLVFQLRDDIYDMGGDDDCFYHYDEKTKKSVGLDDVIDYIQKKYT